MAFDIFKRREVPGDWTMGASFFTTSEDAEQKWNSLLAATNNLNEDITVVWAPTVKGNLAATSFIRQWITFRDTVYSEYKDNARSKIIPDLAWNVWNRGDAKLTELADWRKKFEKLSGMIATAPGPVAEEKHGAEKEKEKSGGIGVWGYVAVGLAGAVALTLVQRRTG